MHIFYYGIWCAGLVGAVSLFMVYFTYRKTIGDISRLPSPKGKWLKEFYRDYQQLRNNNTEVKNPEIFIEKRIKGRKVGAISLHRMKGIVWYTSVLSLAFMGLALFNAYKEGTWKITEFFSQPTIVFTGLGVPIVLIAIRQLLGISFKEESIRNELLDYIENNRQIPVQKAAERPKPVVIEPPKQEEPVNARKSKIKTARVVGTSNKKEGTVQTDQVVEQIAKGIKETAATNGKYTHLLSKEEQDIVRDVIKEFLT